MAEFYGEAFRSYSFIFYLDDKTTRSGTVFLHNQKQHVDGLLMAPLATSFASQCSYKTKVLSSALSIASMVKLGMYKRAKIWRKNSSQAGRFCYNPVSPETCKMHQMTSRCDSFFLLPLPKACYVRGALMGVLLE